MRTLLSSLGICLLVACGGGGGGDNAATAPAGQPTAAARADADRVAVGTTVTLQGSGASPNGGALTYRWQLDAPAGSTATLATAGEARTTWVPDLPGAYTASLVVSDGSASSDPARVTVTAFSLDPIAKVAPTINQAPRTTVQLDGSGSTPPEGGDASRLSHAWTLTLKPEGSAAQLDDASAVFPRFTADVVGLYRATLVVSYDGRASAPAEVTITIAQGNQPPVPKAGANQTVERGQTVKLDGSGSTDPEGSPLQYRWSLSSLPQGSQATLLAHDTATPTFVPDYVGTYGVALEVFDGEVRSQVASGVRITVTKPAGAANTPPKAVLVLSTGAVTEFETGLGSSFPVFYSHDADGDTLTGEWTLLSHPAGFDPAENWNKPWANYIKFTHDGPYRIRMRVFDGKDWSEPEERVITAMKGANRVPVASARLVTRGGTAKVGTTVTLTGEDSSDPDGNRLTYAWTLLQKPFGSTAVLDGANTIRPTFAADKPGSYVVSLVVTDEHGLSSAAGLSQPTRLTVFAKETNQRPVARPAFQFVTNSDEFDTTHLRFESNAYDPDGDILNILWVLKSAPAGFQANVGGTNMLCMNRGWAGNDWPEFANNMLSCGQVTNMSVLLSPRGTSTPLVPGTYVFDLAIGDGVDTYGPHTMSFTLVRRAGCKIPLRDEDACPAAWRE